MSKQSVVSALIGLFAMSAQAKTYKTINSPKAMAFVNVGQGAELKVREVVMADTATTVCFTMEYPKGQSFRFAPTSYLLDENGNRYPLRSAEGLPLNAWVQSPESGTTDFTMHFEPLPKRVQIFDFIEGDGKGAFMLLGIHDKKYKVKAPTLQKLSKEYPYTLPTDWFATDTITIRGCIEGYDAESFGFTTLECYHQDIFEKDAATLVLDIAADGTFEKKFQTSYPIHNSFFCTTSKVGFDEILFFARPGETVDITVKPDESGRYRCYYNSGSSKDVERWLKSDMKANSLTYPLRIFKGKVSEAQVLAEEVWQNLIYRVAIEGRRNHYTSQEMQLALADAQVHYVQAMMDYFMYHEMDITKYEPREGDLCEVILDSVEWEGVNKLENYKSLWRVDFDNPLLLASREFDFMLNRIQYATLVRKLKYEGCIDENGVYECGIENEKKILSNGLMALRKLMGTDKDNFVALLCVYNDMMSEFNGWRQEEYGSDILADTTMTVVEREEAAGSVHTLGNMMSLYLSCLSDPYVHQKAEQYYAAKMAQKNLATPLPADNPAADLIRSLCAKYPGRFLLIDFWGMGCGPCRAAIQQSVSLRDEIAKRDDVKLIFIAGERTAEGSDAYRQYVSQWLPNEETVCVTNTDFIRLQELFRFNGIPHYETITPDGCRVRDDLSLHGLYNFNYEMDRLKKALRYLRNKH
ncbi:MAG: thioredoxin family protein [Bacteroidaceae bacterium]|nr:thioredoxin family protein [Bacteroidaceae bacterium]